MRSVSFWAVLICFVVYYGVGFAGVYTWGFDTKDNILYNYNSLFKDSIDVTIAFIGKRLAIALEECRCHQRWLFQLRQRIPSAFSLRDLDWNLLCWWVLATLYVL